MRSQLATTPEERAAYRALAKAAARLREAQERAERQQQADPAVNRVGQSEKTEGRPDG